VHTSVTGSRGVCRRWAAVSRHSRAACRAELSRAIPWRLRDAPLTFRGRVSSDPRAVECGGAFILGLGTDLRNQSAEKLLQPLEDFASDAGNRYS
jgi:hypothetical protein